MTEVNIITGDARAVLGIMSDESVQTIVTSPPYWGLRNYGVAGQMGLEPTLRGYIDDMVSLFHEMRRVLRDDGTLWLNMGDAFSSNGGARTDRGINEGTKRTALYVDGHRPERKHTQPDASNLERKNKLLMPHRLAIALQDDGWFVRQDNVWHKPNCLPEAVRDRPTTAHEYVFLMSKRETYYYDFDAVRVPVTGGAHGRGSAPHHGPKSIEMLNGGHSGRVRANGSFTRAVRKVAEDGLRSLRSVWEIPTRPFNEAHFATFPMRLATTCILAGSRPGDRVLDPFCGAGTAGVAAALLARPFTGIELNPHYAEIGRRRIRYATRQLALPL